MPLVLLRLLIPINFTQSGLSILQTLEDARQTPTAQFITQIADTKAPMQSYDDAYRQVLDAHRQEGMDVEHLTPAQREELEYEAYEQMTNGPTVGQLAAYILKTIWIAGMAATGLWFLAVNAHFTLRLHRSRHEISAPGCGLRVYVSTATDTPCLFGLIRPAIYLTADMPEDPGCMEHVLAHEQTHYRHGDHIWSVLRCVCTVLHWYNPLVWLCASLSRQDSELACDEATIRYLGESQRTRYGMTLIDMTCEKKADDLLLTATTMVCSGKTIRERIVLIAKRPRTTAYTLVLVILVAVLAVGCTFTNPVTRGIDPPAGPDETTGSTTESTQDTVSGEGEMLEFCRTLLSGTVDPYYQMAAGCVFSDPVKLDLYFFLYSGIPYETQQVTQAELDYLSTLGFTWEYGDMHKMPADSIDAIVTRYFGITMADLEYSQPYGWMYYDKTDCYYVNRSDAYVPSCTVTACEEGPDKTVRIYYTADHIMYIPDGPYHYDKPHSILHDAEMVMTIKHISWSTWQILSNEFA